MRILSDWTETDIQILRQNFLQEPEVIKSLLANRTWSSIYQKGHALGLSRPRLNQFKNPWTENQVETLRKLWSRMPEKDDLILATGHPWTSVRDKAGDLGLRERRVFISHIDFQTLSEMQIGYIAGIIDGEGSIGIVCQRRPMKRLGLPFNFVPYLEISMTHKGAIEYLKELLLKCGLHPSDNNRKRNHPNWSDVYAFFVTRQAELRELLYFLLPYLRVRHRQAELVKNFIDSRLPKLRTCYGSHTGASYTKEEIEIYQEVVGLNKFKVKFSPEKLANLHSEKELKI